MQTDFKSAWAEPEIRTIRAIRGQQSMPFCLFPKLTETFSEALRKEFPSRAEKFSAPWRKICPLYFRGLTKAE